MLKKNCKDYYSIIKEISVLIFNEYNLIRFVEYNNDEEKKLLEKVYFEKFYNILLDIVNQSIYDTINDFSSDDVEFIINFEIDKILPDIIKIIYKKIDIKKLKMQENRKLKSKKTKK